MLVMRLYRMSSEAAIDEAVAADARRDDDARRRHRHGSLL